MKKLIFSGLLALTFANATSLSNLGLGVGIGTGYIDDNYKNIIVRFEKSFSYFNFNLGGKLANNYLKSFINTKPYFINRVLVNGGIGIEKFKINNKNQFQSFINFNTFMLTPTRFNPILNVQVGTKSVVVELGVFMRINNKTNFKYEIGKRFLYTKINNKKDTTSTAIYFNYLF